MLILVRQIRMRGEQVVDQRDAELETDALRIGSGKDQDLQLFGEAVGTSHAVLQPGSEGQLRIDCKGGHQITVADGDVGRARLALGEWARIGTHRVAPADAPPGFDAAIELRIDADASQSIRDRLGDELRLKIPGKRFYSYTALVVVALFGLGLPMLGFYYPEIGDTVARNGGPTDQLWLTGPLADAHHVPGIADDCNVCHTEPFQQVRNRACLECHDQTTTHFARAHPLTDEFHGECGSCHREHNEPPTLIVRNKTLCTDCHAETQERLVEASPPVTSMPVASAPAEVEPVAAFTAEGHPQFTAALLRRTKTGWRVHRERLGSDDARAASNLKFPHDVHLSHDKVSLADGPSREDRALVCGDCHKLGKDGEHFEPVSMEATCSGCHSLAFDDAQPDRQLPHGEPDKLRTYLEEFYIRQAAQQQREAPRARARRVPNTSLQGRRCEGEPLDCGLAWADEEMDKLFTKAGCVSCHEVYRESDEWQVQPVRLVQDWFAAARFDHMPHLNPGARSDGKTCLGCHEASDSSESRDVLMPGIDNCVQCHTEDRATGVASQCVDCHSFHRPGLSAMGES